MVVLGIDGPKFIGTGIKFIKVRILNQVYSNTIIVKPTKGMIFVINKILGMELMKRL